MADQPPQGQRFSHVYIQRGEPTQDSQRMRRRLASLVYDFKDMDYEFSSYLTREQGVAVPYNVVSDWPTFYQKCELRDVLDSITTGYRFLQNKTRTGIKEMNAPTRWVTEAARILREENVHYKVDAHGGVHFTFDAEFDRNVGASIASLQGARYRNALASFSDCMVALGETPPDGKRAIRGVFAAAEGLFRLMFPNSPRLTSGEVQKLEPLLQQAYAQDKTARGAASKVLNAFKGWIDAAHFYRHEPGQEEPAQPPLTLAVQMVSLGASFVRWLAELDSGQQS